MFIQMKSIQNIISRRSKTYNRFVDMHYLRPLLLQAIFAHELFELCSKMMKNNDLRIFHTKQKGYDV